MMVSSPRARTLVAVAAVLAPRAVRRFLHGRLLGYRIDASARIGRSLIDVDEFQAAPGASVANLSVIRGCERVELGVDASVGPLVWVNAVRKSSTQFFVGEKRETTLTLRRASAITSLHFIDCCDRVELAEFSLIGGMMSQVLTHSFDYKHGRQTTCPVTVGAYTIIGTHCLLLPGTEVGEKCVVGGGSVLTGGRYAELSMHAGVPASVKAALDPQAGFFVRTEANIR